MSKTKQALQDDLHRDITTVRGALLEIIEKNRKLNQTIFKEIEASDLHLLEEYGILQKSILDSAKILSDIHATQPKTLKDIDQLQQEKQKINLDDLLDE